MDKQIDSNIFDGALFTNDATSFFYCNHFAANFGIIVNKLAGANLYTASALSRQIEKGCIVIILPDEVFTKFNNIPIYTHWMSNSGLDYNFCNPKQAKIFHLKRKVNLNDMNVSNHSKFYNCN